MDFKIALDVNVESMNEKKAEETPTKDLPLHDMRHFSHISQQQR